MFMVSSMNLVILSTNCLFAGPFKHFLDHAYLKCLFSHIFLFFRTFRGFSWHNFFESYYKAIPKIILSQNLFDPPKFQVFDIFGPKLLFVNF